MSTSHDDLPHPVPPMAYLRYKENWLFIFIDAANSVFGVAHFNYEPGFDRGRASCNLLVQGKLIKYANQFAFPADFAYSPQIGDEKLNATFVEPYEHIDLALTHPEASLRLAFRKAAPPFDFEAYEAANPEKPRAEEILNFATHQEFHHQQQAMTITGSLTLRDGNRTIALKGLGYRDHSRGMRADNLLLAHLWTFLYFPSRVFAVMTVTGRFRPGITAVAGYLHDTSGMRSLRDIAILRQGEGPDKLPKSIEFNVADVYGKSHTIVADVANRLGQVPLVTEASGAGGFGYSVFENFCAVHHRESGENGFALVEIGYSTTPGK
jgi:hypothetical protein